MKVEFNINKIWFFSLFSVVLIAFGLFFVYSYPSSLSAIPNPGHELSSIQGYFLGDTNLKDSLGKFCQSDGTNCQPAPSPEIQYCNTYNTSITFTGTITLSLIKNNRNMCIDASGCTFKIWATSQQHPEGNALYTFTFKQLSDGRWFESVSGITGINGDSTRTNLFTDWRGGTLYDDEFSSPTFPGSPNDLIFVDGAGVYGFVISICDY